MKFDVSRLKSFDYKQFGIDHGEKIGIALIALFVALALWGTNWRQSPITPEQLQKKAESTLEAVNTSKWPPDEATKLAGNGDKLTTRIDKLLVPIDPAPFQLTQAFNPSWHPEKVRIKDPRWLPVKDVIADAGVAELMMDPKVPPLEENFVRKAPPKPTESKDKAHKGHRKEKKSAAKKEVEEIKVGDEFKPRSGRSGGAEAGVHALRGLLGSREDRKDKRHRFDEEPADDTLKPGALKLARRQTNNGRGYRFVAVRGVFPLHEQALALANAMGKQYDRDVQNLVQVNDFQIERQTMLPGPDPWSGPWERLDREPTIEMFKNEIVGFAPERVADGIIDRTMCMPYPERVVGVWGDLETHPDIKNFVLSDDEVDTQAELERHVIERMKEVLDKRKKLFTNGNRGGWSGVAPNMDMRHFGRFMPGMSKSFEQQILEEMENTKSPDLQAIQEKIKDFIRTRGSAEQHLLLFRYLDFIPASDQGKTYRYRVRLVMQNPFFERTREEVADPSIAIGKERETEYSEPTAPVYVPEDARFYLARVDDRVGRASLPRVDLDLYQWFESTGTVVNRMIGAQLGQVIGGKENADVLRPAEDTFDNEKVPFSTGRALVDVSRRFSLDSNLHGDILKALTTKDGKRPDVFGPNEALVVDEHGNLILLDDFEQGSDHQQAKSRYKQQIEPYKDLREDNSEEARKKKKKEHNRREGNPVKKLRDSTALGAE